MEQINWQPSSNSIADLKDWTNNHRLELQPPFQRKSVWGNAARIMLMDTILKNIPMPKIFVSNLVKNSEPYRSVIDGQQRISAILAFIKDEFELKKPYKGEHIGKKFSELPEEIRNKFFRYKLDFNEINDASDEQLREIYSRVNKYSLVLTAQEMRRSDFPGDFLTLSEKLAVHSFFDKTKIFTMTNRRRLGDVEYISELLAGLIDGIQDKKNTLDDFYQNYATWSEADKEKIKIEFDDILKDIALIFNGEKCNGESGPKTAYYHEPLKFNGLISKTRFKQKADFYALFFAISGLRRQKLNIKDKDLNNLRLDLDLMDKYTDPHSEIELFREYATKCLSDANSKGSREWRTNFLTAILLGTYADKMPYDANKLLGKIGLDLAYSKGFIGKGDYGCPTGLQCGICESEDNIFNDENTDMIDPHNPECKQEILYWDEDEPNHQLVNSKFICNECFDKK